MAVHFHQLRIKELHKETSGSIIITFDVPEQLEQLFQFIPGQNLTVKTVCDGEEVRRSYSICTAPLEKKLSIAVKNVAGGKFSNHANTNLQTGDTLDVLPPTGRFITSLDANYKKNYLAFAAGSGITPIISIIKTALAVEQQSSFTLVYGNQSRGSIMFFEELEGLKNRYLQRFNLIHVLSREITDAPINSGRIDGAKLNQLKRLLNYSRFDETFICGPQAMLFCIREFLKLEGIPEKNVHFELFTTPGQNKVEKNFASLETALPLKSAITIKLDGRSISFDLPNHNESILDAALMHGADLPYACKGGVCSSCRAKLTKGKVTMDANYALEQEEIDAGFILTCQSHPLTEEVVIDFDLR